MKPFSCILLMCFFLLSCHTSRQIESAHVLSDSTSHYRQKIDSLYQAIVRRDSTYQRDSVFLYVKGDTVTKYVERTRYQIRTLTDTVTRFIFLHDTAYISRQDSTMVSRQVVEEKPVKWHERLFMLVGRMCCLAFLLWMMFIYLKRRL